MNEMDMLSPEKVAAEYGGNKQKIAQAVQMGLIQPTVAVMAGMFIDRMRGAAAQEQTPQSTVAQDVMAAPQMAPAGLGAIAQAPVESGLGALPTPNLDNAEYAGGGIVAFDNGGMAGTFEGFMPSEPSGEPLIEPDIPEELTGKIGLPQVYGIREGRYGRTKEEILKSFGIKPSVSAVQSAPTTPADVVPTTTAAAAPVSKATEGVNIKAADKALTDYAKKVKDINKEFGVSDEPDAKARAALDKYKEKLNKDLDKAGALGLISAGLGIAGGKSRYALQNLQGAMPAIEQYGKAMSQIREGEKGVLDSEAKLDQAADARARGNVKLALELEKDAKELAARERQVAASERQANKPSQFAEQYALYAADEKAAGRKPSFEGFRKALTTSDETTGLNRIRYAQEALAKDINYLRLVNSPKAEDQARAAEIERKTYATFGAASMGGSNIPPNVQSVLDKYISRPQ